MKPLLPPGAIGIFDSGVGGLTVARELRRALPGESLLYFGDTLHVPYGSKSPSTVRELSRRSAAFLAAQGVKLIVVACNTSTAVALPDLRREFPMPVLGVIEPGARAAVESSPGGRIAVIGTRRTIASGAYEAAIHALAPRAKVRAGACPLLVPVIEEGLRSTRAIDAILREYLDGLVKGCDSLVLGCTHYPLLKPRLRRLYPRLRLVDSAFTTARETARLLEERSLSAKGGRGRLAICTNDVNEVFTRISGRLFPGERIHAVSLE